MTTTTQIRLIACYDLRTIDPITGEKEPLADGQGCTCDRCGKFHAVVYQVAEFEGGKGGMLRPVAGSYREVGSSCFKKLFGATPAVFGRNSYVREYSGQDARRQIDINAGRVAAKPVAPELSLSDRLANAREEADAARARYRAGEPGSEERRQAAEDMKSWMDRAATLSNTRA